MPTDQAVELGRRTLQEVVILGGPILAIAMLVSLIVNLVQVLTSIQEPTISTVPRLLAAGTGIFFLMPWMWRHLCQFTIRVLSDLSVYLR